MAERIIAIIRAIALLVSFLACASGWAISYNGMKALLLYMKDKNYELPDKAERRKYCKRAAKHTLGL